MTDPEFTHIEFVLDRSDLQPRGTTAMLDVIEVGASIGSSDAGRRRE